MTPRQEFEEFIKDMDCQLASNDRLTLDRTAHRYESLAVELAWQAWLDRLELIKHYRSANWKLVPKEPTREMITAACKSQSNRATVPRDDELAYGFYITMVEAV